MDEFNLASRFASEEDERPMRGRGRVKRLRKGRTGVGMEKPEDVIIPEDEEMPELPLGDEEENMPLPDFGEGPEPDIEEDAAFEDLVDRMEGGSASAGRAAARRDKLKGRRPQSRRFEDEE